MSTKVILDLPNETYARAAQLAQLTNRDVADVLTDALTLSLPPLQRLQNPLPISKLNNDEVLRLAHSQMNAAESLRFSTLQDKQQAGLLNEIERNELARLFEHYQVGLLQKALALAEAVRRGLLPPLTS